MYQPRTYRHWVKSPDLVSFRVVIKETDLYVRAASNLEKEVVAGVSLYRSQIEEYISRRPDFLTTLEPYEVELEAPDIIREMAAAAKKAGVGPMATVAGAISAFVGRDVLPVTPELLIENGGDIYLASQKDRVVGIYAGQSPLSGQIGLEIKAADTPLGICTSSGKVGHSLSFGQADAAIIISKDALLADAVATATGNMVKTAADINKALEFACGIDGVSGALIIVGEKMGVKGQVYLSRL